MKRKFTKILGIGLTLALLVSMLVMVVPVSASPGPILGFWEPGSSEAVSTVEYSTDQSHSPSSSVYLKALIAESASDDNREIYVGEPTGVTDLNSLTNVSFWYYAVEGSDPVPPEIDIWLASGSYDYGPPPTGDNEWLLGQFPEVTTWNEWVEVSHSVITWIRATGGTIYGEGSDGLTAAKAELGDYQVLAVGIQVGGPATRHTNRAGDQEFYVDDLTINAITYDLAPSAMVEMTASSPGDIIGISVSPTSVGFGVIAPNVTAGSDNPVTVSNTGNVDASLSASIINASVPDVYTTGLTIETSLVGIWTGLVVVGSTTSPLPLTLTVPSGTLGGTYTATLIFWAEATP